MMSDVTPHGAREGLHGRFDAAHWLPQAGERKREIQLLIVGLVGPVAAAVHAPFLS